MNENKYNESVIISVTDWINKNLDQRLSIDDIAEKAGYSKWYLQKLFSRYHNETLAHYIRRKKLISCINDLKYSHAPIISLAVKYHFESQQSFTRSFKQMMGCTPSVCRKSQRLNVTDSNAHPCSVCSKAENHPIKKLYSGINETFGVSHLVRLL
ncbi:AraC family transcriptional regulator [Pantoea ananatis]|jgi:AraC-like DNA-binding protein|uniref:HTH araC/xylS-type domain-containing protein n=1 Tax=Pantoea ananas TaxID=553 RepID=A0AAJ1FQ58_PANAN|nr:helix-turn-helix domain-containing protein [Pantoea ananatis]AWQ20858.1 AraC family transcriptional regulator [Pantoea ananatis]KGL57603.1 AraC family transcriptional regulator [Pantoea ananatis]KTR47565.1 AraC family transcriptional regulator [Pantoea ananatis]KTR56969.1 AraC family transcriptional regulator [Pantoea ananatis]KTR66501.1 AraC family transcriptional regulator [Pantoea ananatis]